MREHHVRREHIVGVDEGRQRLHLVQRPQIDAG